MSPASNYCNHPAFCTFEIKQSTLLADIVKQIVLLRFTFSAAQESLETRAEYRGAPLGNVHVPFVHFRCRGSAIQNLLPGTAHAFSQIAEKSVGVKKQKRRR